MPEDEGQSPRVAADLIRYVSMIAVQLWPSGLVVQGIEGAGVLDNCSADGETALLLDDEGKLLPAFLRYGGFSCQHSNRELQDCVSGLPVLLPCASSIPFFLSGDRVTNSRCSVSGSAIWDTARLAPQPGQ